MRNNKFIKKLFFTSFFVFPIFSLAQEVTLDITFDGDGKQTTDFYGYWEEPFAVAIQTDGKIILAGRMDNFGGKDIALARYNINGSLDTSFDFDGKVTTAIGTGDDEAFGLVIQPDGKIVVAGDTKNGTYYDIALVRYNIDGSLDLSFGIGGKVVTSIGNTSDFANSIALQNDGKIIVGGGRGIDLDQDFAVLRYNNNGILDNSFGTNGIVTTEIGVAYDYITDLKLQTDGKIIVTGTTENGGNTDFALARYNTDGSLDNTFGIGGKVITSVGSSEIPYSIALQNDQKILVAGSTGGDGYKNFALVRYNSNGSLDTSFDTDGKVITTIGTADDDARSVVIQNDGKILLGGYSYTPLTSNNFAMVRYNTDGSLDTSFDTDGKLITPIVPSYDGILALAIQTDGKIVAAGSSLSSSLDFTIARYNNPSLSINQNEQQILAIKIFPNPTISILNINLQNNLEFQKATIYNTLGQIIKTETTQNINVSNLSEGTYFIEVETDKGKATQSFIKD